MDETEPVVEARGRWTAAHERMLAGLEKTLAADAFDDVGAEIIERVQSWARLE